MPHNSFESQRNIENFGEYNQVKEELKKKILEKLNLVRYINDRDILIELPNFDPTHIRMALNELIQNNAIVKSRASFKTVARYYELKK